MPDAVQRALEFREDGGGADQQDDRADDAGDPASLGIRDAAQECFHRQGALLADQPRDLGHDLRLGSVAPEQGACDGDDDHQQGGQREKIV